MHISQPCIKFRSLVKQKIIAYNNNKKPAATICVPFNTYRRSIWREFVDCIRCSVASCINNVVCACVWAYDRRSALHSNWKSLTVLGVCDQMANNIEICMAACHGCAHESEMPVYTINRHTHTYTYKSHRTNFAYVYDHSRDTLTMRDYERAMSAVDSRSTKWASTLMELWIPRTRITTNQLDTHTNTHGDLHVRGKNPTR